MYTSILPVAPRALVLSLSNLQMMLEMQSNNSMGTIGKEELWKSEKIDTPAVSDREGMVEEEALVEAMACVVVVDLAGEAGLAEADMEVEDIAAEEGVTAVVEVADTPAAGEATPPLRKNQFRPILSLISQHLEEKGAPPSSFAMYVFMSGYVDEVLTWLASLVNQQRGSRRTVYHYWQGGTSRDQI